MHSNDSKFAESLFFFCGHVSLNNIKCQVCSNHGHTCCDVVLPQCPILCPFLFIREAFHSLELQKGVVPVHLWCKSSVPVHPSPFPKTCCSKCTHHFECNHFGSGLYEKSNNVRCSSVLSWGFRRNNKNMSR